jgi:hypothetical protein
MEALGSFIRTQRKLADLSLRELAVLVAYRGWDGGQLRHPATPASPESKANNGAP